METAILDSKRRFRMAMELTWFVSASFGAGLLAAIVAAAFVLLLAQPAYAHTVRNADFICPIDGEAFSQRVDASGTMIGRMLDLKPYGYIAAPWTLPVCPTTGFVMYRAKFSDEDVKQLKPYVASDEYRVLRQSETTYYLAAKLKTVLREPQENIAFTLLQATWQARGREQYERYAREALAAHRGLLESPPTEEQKWTTLELVAGELERRLGMFDLAKARFERLKTLEAFGRGVLPDIVELQLKLISEQDTKSHRIPRKDRPPVKPAER